MRRILFNQKYSGFLWAAVFTVLFIAANKLARPFFDGSSWFWYSSIARIIFGILILLLVKKLYGRSPGDVINFKNSKIALIAGFGFLLYLIYYATDISLGVKAITGLTAGLIISRIFLQQLATGFYEELNYRLLTLEGYFFGKKTIAAKLFFAFSSAVIFGYLHVLEQWNTHTFLLTGAIGFAYAVMYLKSRNILIPMILHFAYDILANLTNYFEWNGSAIFMRVDSAFNAVLVIMFAVSLVMLLIKDTGELQSGKT